MLAHALPGDLDPSFGNGGKVITDFGECHQITCLAFQNDGKILAAGSSRLGGSAWVVARYHPDGRLDDTFGSGGSTFTTFGDTYSYCSSMAVDAIGRIVLAGKTGKHAEDCDFAVTRYLADGTLDTSFGDHGGRVTPSSGRRGAESVLIQKDGKIVVTGSGQSLRETIILLRYDSKGMLDRDFGSGGMTIIGFPGNFWNLVSSGTGKSLLQPDGRIVVAGALRSRFVLARVNPDGTRDSTFLWKNSSEEVVSDSPRTVHGLFAGNDGGLLVTGDLSNRISSYPLVSSYDRNGLSKGSPVSSPAPGSPGSPTAAAMDENGNLMIAGNNSSGEPSFFSLARFTKQGWNDPAFGQNGVSVTRFGRIEDTPHAMVIQPDGRIITAGYSEIARERGAFALARHMGGQLRPDIRVGSDKEARLGKNLSYASLPLTFPAAGATRQAYLVIQNDGSITDSFTVRGSPSDANFRVHYFQGSKDVTRKVVMGTYTTRALKPGASHRLRLEITTQKTKNFSSREFQIEATSKKSPAGTDDIFIFAYHDAH